MLSKYKDELLQEKIDDMDQLDRIELQNKIILYEGIQVENSPSILAIILMVGASILATTTSNLKLYGLEYAIHLHFVKFFLIAAFFFIALHLIEMISYHIKRSKISKRIDEFIRENAD